MPFLQDILHRVEQGGGMRYVRISLAVLAVGMLAFGYNWRAFRNMSTLEAMDSAQVARNIAEGNGFTTLFIRPFSMYLVKKHTLETEGPPKVGQVPDLAQLRGMHPDLANPPLYPAALALLMKVAPFRYGIITNRAFWSDNGRFWRFEPDFLIALFNQLLFFAVLVLVFFLARRLFDGWVAWISTGLLLFNELLWRFSVSGLSTMLLMLIFVGLAWFLVLLDEETRAPKWGPPGVLALAGLAGAMVGLGGLTRYSFAWLIVPVVVYIVLFCGKQRIVLALVTVATFLALLTPWVVRNYTISGTPFGTATFSVLEDTVLYPEYRLQRSLEPDFTRLYLKVFWLKLNINLHKILSNDLPRLGGTWVSAFFLVGLMVGFRNPSVSRLRYFLMSCLPVLILTQALGRTRLSEDSIDINSENQLVLLTPLVLVYGVSLFFTLLDHIQVPFPEVRLVVIVMFVLALCVPMFFVFLPPRSIPVAYPPYYPPAIQTVTGWLKEKEMAMSDIPWAVAWYGRRQCVWLTLKCTPDKDQATHEDFFAINDYQKPISLLYLTPQTMDSRFLTQWVRAGEQSWGNFILESMVKKKVPDYFPLSESQAGWLPEQLVLTDWQRWRRTP
jgi:hypothetical protein